MRVFSDATEEWEGLQGRPVKANGAMHVLVEGDHCCTASFMGKALSMFTEVLFIGKRLCYLWAKTCVYIYITKSLLWLLMLRQ